LHLFYILCFNLKMSLLSTWQTTYDVTGHHGLQYPSESLRCRTHVWFLCWKYTTCKSANNKPLYIWSLGGNLLIFSWIHLSIIVWKAFEVVRIYLPTYTYIVARLRHEIPYLRFSCFTLVVPRVFGIFQTHRNIAFDVLLHSVLLWTMCLYLASHTYT